MFVIIGGYLPLFKMKFLFPTLIRRSLSTFHNPTNPNDRITDKTLIQKPNQGLLVLQT